MTNIITERAEKYIVRKVENSANRFHPLESNEQYIGRKIFQTANGLSYSGVTALSEGDKKSLRGFCRQVTGHRHFHHINPLEYKFIGEAAIAYAQNIANI